MISSAFKLGASDGKTETDQMEFVVSNPRMVAHGASKKE